MSGWSLGFSNFIRQLTLLQVSNEKGWDVFEKDFQASRRWCIYLTQKNGHLLGSKHEGLYNRFCIQKGVWISSRHCYSSSSWDSKMMWHVFIGLRMDEIWVNEVWSFRLFLILSFFFFGLVLGIPMRVSNLSSWGIKRGCLDYKVSHFFIKFLSASV
jgi:hypothetical protein